MLDTQTCGPAVRRRGRRYAAGVDDIDRRAMRMGRLRFLIEAEVGLAVSSAIGELDAFVQRGLSFVRNPPA